jgi:hypothetical protein
MDIFPQLDELLSDPFVLVLGGCALAGAAVVGALWFFFGGR